MGRSLDTQYLDSLTGGSITVRKYLFDEMTRETTQNELQNIRDFLDASLRAEQAEQLNGWQNLALGWERMGVQNAIAEDAEKLREMYATGDFMLDELEMLEDRVARNKWKLDQMLQPENSGAWSAYNLGAGVRSMTPGLLAEIGFFGGEALIGLGAAAIAPHAAPATISAAAIAAGRRIVRAKNIAKRGYQIAKGTYMWDLFSRRESGGMYADIMDRTDLTEEQKQAMAVTYGRLSGAVELLGWNLGAGGLAASGIKAVSKKFAAPLEKWTADAAFKNTIKSQMEKEAAKTLAGKATGALKVGARVVGAAAAESAEEGTQRAFELATLEQGLAGKTPNVATVVGEGFKKLAGVPVELVQGKLSDESIAILEAMGSAVLPSLVVGGAGAIMSESARYASEVSPADTGITSGFTIKNNSLKSSILSAEKNLSRLNAVSTFMGDQSKTTEHKLKLIDDMVKNAEIEGFVHFAPEDTEVLLALGESSPTLSNTMVRLGITNAIKEGQKTGTVSVPMRAFAELASQKEVRESDAGKQLNISGTLSLEDSSYSRIQRNVLAGQKKGKELLEKPSAKLQQKLAGLRRQFESAGYAPEEVEANLAVFTSALATLAEASNGAVTADELIDEFKFKIEKRNFDIKSKDVEGTVKKILSDKRPLLGQFSRFIEKGRKPISTDIAKLNVESVAAEMAAIDANEKEYAGETIKINGKERSVYNSHGVRIAKSAKALKAFYKWFGNSKAVDELGRPKVLYHGTPRASFLSFVAKDGKQRFFFTDDISIAETYSGSSHIVTREEAEGSAAGDVDPSAGIYQVYLKIENPEEVDYNGKPWTGDEDIALNIKMEDGTLATDKDGSPILITTMEEAAEFFKSGTYGQASLVPAPGIVASTDMEAEKAKDRGFDGAILKNVLDVGDMARLPENEYPVSTVYVTFEPEQIKSTDNYGAFDPRAVDMYRSLIRTAFAGSSTDYLLPALKAIGTGEGHFAHGWGLYYALRFDIADRYRRRYQKSGMYVVWDGEDIDDLYWDVALNDKKDYYIPVEILSLIRSAVDSTVKHKTDIAKYNKELFSIHEQLQMWAERLNGFRRQAFYRNKGFDLLKLSDEQILRQYGEEDAAFFRIAVVNAMKMSEQEIEENKKKALENIKWLKNRMQETKDNIIKQDIKEIRKKIKENIADRINHDISFTESKIEAFKDSHIPRLKKYAEETSAKLSRMTSLYKEAVAKRKEEIKAALDPDTKITEVMVREMAIKDVDDNIETLRGGLENVKEQIADAEKYIKDAEEYINKKKAELAFVSKKGFFNKITIEDKTNVGQVKEVTVRKIDTFMRENSTLGAQPAAVKRAIIKMLSSENELAEKFSLPDFSDAFLMMDRDEQEAFKAKVKKKAAAALKHIPSEFVEEAVNNAFTQFTVYSRNEEEAVADFTRQRDKFPENSTIYREYDAKIQAVKALWPYVKESGLELVADFFYIKHTGRTFYTGLVNIFLGKEPWDSGGKYEKIDVHEAKKKASLMLHKYGINGISYKGYEDGECLVVFDSSILRVKQSYFSRRKDMPHETVSSEFDIFSEDTGIRGPKQLYVAKHADITTFAHEVMHFVTRGLIEMYNDGSISEPWRKQIEKLYEHFSVMPSRHGPSAMHKEGKKIIMETEASETLSGGFQQYMEWGKASDSALEKLFAFIKDLASDLWKVLNRGYYKDQALDDVQVQFYDKVMQAHVDVKTAEYKYGYAPLDKMPGVSDEEYEEYTIERKVSRARSSNTLFQAQRNMVKNRKRAEWIKFYDEEFNKASAELRNEPEYRVMKFIVDNGGLNKDSFKSGTRLWASVPQKYFSKKDSEGVTVEQLSAKFGPEISIADIAKILANTPSLDVAARRRARTEADRRFLEEYNPAADVTPANAMRTIMFIRSLVKESLMIKGEPLSSFPAHYAAWIKEAENYFMGLTIRNAKDLEKWANMESRVIDDFMTALTSGNTDQASLKADQRAMVNYVIVRSKQFRKQEAAFKRRFKKFYSAPAGKDIKVMDGVTWNLIHTILQEYGFTRKSGRINASAKEQFVAWCEARKGKKYFPYETMMNELGLLSSIPKNSSLNVETFSRMAALLEAIRSIGEAEKRVFDGEKRAQLDVVAGEIIDNIMNIRATKGDKAFLGYGKGTISRFTVPQMGMLEPLFGELGMRKLYVQLRNALVARDDLADNTRAFIADSFEKNGMLALLADKSEFMVGERVVNNHILLFALQHSGNDHNRDNAIKTLQQYYKDDSFSEAEFEDFLNATPMGMRNYVNDLWAMFKNMKTLIDQQTREATGELIATVEAKGYTLRDGTEMTGGYFPAKKVNKVGITDPLDTYFDNNFLFPRAGLLKDRIKNATGNLDLSQDSLSRWIFQAVNLATTQVAFNDIATIFQDEAVITALGPNASLVTQYVNDWLQCAVMPIAPQPKSLRAIAKAPTVVFLGFKAVSGLVQLLGTLVGLTEVSAPSLFASSGKILNVGKYFKIKEEMSKRSAFMADRARKFDSRFFGLMKDQNMLERAGRKYGDGIVEVSMSFIRTFQCMADMVVWDGAFADGKKSGMSDKDASDHADYVVMKTQGDRVQMNTPEGFQGVLKFFQPFMSYILTLSQIGNAAIRSKNFKKFGMLVAMIVLSNAVEAYLKENDKEWRRKMLGKKTKGSDYDFWKRYRNRFFVQTISTLGDVAFPFAGLGGTMALSLTEDAMKELSPGYRAYSAGATPAVEVLTKAAKAITMDKKTWESVYDQDMSLGANLVDFVL
jgi:hypothetical protein